MPSEPSLSAACSCGDHAFWTTGKSFRWCRPQFNVYRPADPRPRLLLNRYPHNVIGAAAVIFGRCWVVNWKR